jgi:hypothetical protein
MTKPELLEKIRLKCVEANAEILELKFGCVVMAEVRLEGTILPSHTILKHTIYSIEGIDGMARYHGVGQQHSSFWRSDIKEIIGREITLEDVLVAIRTLPLESPLRDIITSAHPLYREGTTIKLWQLTKPLSDQSEETLKFIYDILYR